ncbi:MAG: hypothetical protein Q8R31_06695 [Candidatus Omnitrophota bacterium]|nr:hypothetical protein [Candidatus Omnitrophota bacterium]
MEPIKAICGYLKPRLKRMALSSWIAIGIATLGLIVSVRSCNISGAGLNKAEEANRLSNTANGVSVEANSLSREANKIAKEVFDIQNTPRLFAFIASPSYAGSVPNRTDEIVSVPIVISNNSNAFAYNVEVDVIFADGTGKVISLNEQEKKIPAPAIFKDRLTPSEQWVIGTFPSTFPGARESYILGKSKCKAKLQVKWKGAKGEKYKFINLEELKFARITDKVVTEYFWFDSLNNYSSIDDPKEVDKNWGMNINY